MCPRITKPSFCTIASSGCFSRTSITCSETVYSLIFIAEEWRGMVVMVVVVVVVVEAEWWWWWWCGSGDGGSGHGWWCWCAWSWLYAVIWEGWQQFDGPHNDHGDIMVVNDHMMVVNDSVINVIMRWRPSMFIIAVTMVTSLVFMVMVTLLAVMVW